MAAPGERRVTEDQILAWRGTGHPYKLIAAAIAERAAGKERGTVLPDDDFFGTRRAPMPASERSTRDVRRPYR